MSGRAILRLFAILAAVSLGAFGCTGPFDTADAARSDTGWVHLSVIESSVSASTLVPDLPAIAQFLLQFSGPSAYGTLTVPDPALDPIAIPQLPAGTWTIDVLALDRSGRTVASGTTQVSVAIGVGSTATVAVAPTQLDTGAISITIDWSGATAISAGEITVVSSFIELQGGGELDTIPLILPSSRTATITVDPVPSGEHILFVELEDDGIVRATFSSAIHVYDGVTLSHTEFLTDGDFAFVPAAPDSVAVAESLGAVEVTWSSSDSLADGFLIERGTAPDARSYLAEVPGTARSFLDTTATAGTDYYYLVTAFNDVGSAPAPTVAGPGRWSSPAEVENSAVTVTPLSGQISVDVHPSGIPALAGGFVRLQWFGEAGQGSAEVGVSGFPYVIDAAPSVPLGLAISTVDGAGNESDGIYLEGEALP